MIQHKNEKFLDNFSKILSFQMFDFMASWETIMLTALLFELISRLIITNRKLISTNDFYSPSIPFMDDIQLIESVSEPVNCWHSKTKIRRQKQSKSGRIFLECSALTASASLVTAWWLLLGPWQVIVDHVCSRWGRGWRCQAIGQIQVWTQDRLPAWQRSCSMGYGWACLDTR